MRGCRVLGMLAVLTMSVVTRALFLVMKLPGPLGTIELVTLAGQGNKGESQQQDGK
jgi:hypothetical protein